MRCVSLRLNLVTLDLVIAIFICAFFEVALVREPFLEAILDLLGVLLEDLFFLLEYREPLLPRFILHFHLAGVSFLTD